MCVIGGAKSGNVEKVSVFRALEGSRGARPHQKHELPSESGRLGGGKGRINLGLFGGFGGLEGLSLGRRLYMCLL